MGPWVPCSREGWVDTRWTWGSWESGEMDGGMERRVVGCVGQWAERCWDGWVEVWVGVSVVGLMEGWMGRQVGW